MQPCDLDTGRDPGEECNLASLPTSCRSRTIAASSAATSTLVCIVYPLVLRRTRRWALILISGSW